MYWEYKNNVNDIIIKNLKIKKMSWNITNILYYLDNVNVQPYF